MFSSEMDDSTSSTETPLLPRGIRTLRTYMEPSHQHSPHYHHDPSVCPPPPPPPPPSHLSAQHPPTTTTTSANLHIPPDTTTTTTTTAQQEQQPPQPSQSSSPPSQAHPQPVHVEHGQEEARRQQFLKTSVRAINKRTDIDQERKMALIQALFQNIITTRIKPTPPQQQQQQQPRGPAYPRTTPHTLHDDDVDDDDNHPMSPNKRPRREEAEDKEDSTTPHLDHPSAHRKHPTENRVVPLLTPEQETLHRSSGAQLNSHSSQLAEQNRPHRPPSGSCVSCLCNNNNTNANEADEHPTVHHRRACCGSTSSSSSPDKILRNLFQDRRGSIPHGDGCAPLDTAVSTNSCDTPAQVPCNSPRRARAGARDQDQSQHSPGHDNCESADAADDPSRFPVNAHPWSEPGLFPGRGAKSCRHYQRKCWLLAACCQKYYPCRRCHDEVEDHAIDRHATSFVACTACGATEQPVAEHCTTCSTSFASYFCAICRFYESCEGKDIYHCERCGICRVGKGLEIDNHHCMRCNTCVPMEVAFSHPCLERSLDGNCPICSEYMATSVEQVVFMRCGHAMHEMCFKQYIVSGYTCPICSKSLTEMGAWYRALDERLASEKLPIEYERKRSRILCHDCGAKTATRYHYQFHKCQCCGAYNTRVLSHFWESVDDQTSIRPSASNEAITVPRYGSGGGWEPVRRDGDDRAGLDGSSPPVETALSEENRLDVEETSARSTKRSRGRR